MFEESNQNATYTDRIFGRFKIVVLEMVADGTNWTVDAANSSPGIAAAAGGNTIALTGLPKSANYWFPGSPDVVGQATTVVIASESPGTGAVTLTASAATAGHRFQWFFLANRTG